MSLLFVVLIPILSRCFISSLWFGCTRLCLLLTYEEFQRFFFCCFFTISRWRCGCKNRRWMLMCVFFIPITFLLLNFRCSFFYTYIFKLCFYFKSIFFYKQIPIGWNFFFLINFVFNLSVFLSFLPICFYSYKFDFEI